ncbi:MAG: hypothetical protein EOM54_06235 [Clostridia bacterium]|nr:hypothetical protein [Clostridia bacterium]NCC69163.1 hypothetical protein [Clostridia bacterium]
MTEKKPALIYINIPFCIRKEKYSARALVTGSNAAKEEYMDALDREIIAAAEDFSDREIESVYIGGGSPTVMNPDRLGKTLASIRKNFSLSRNCEICFEALPNTVCVPSLTGIAAGKPTRTELMMHSVNARELDALGCAFVPADVQNAILFFDKFHLNNVGLHITYGLPFQTAGSWMTTLRACMEFGAPHVTLDPLSAKNDELPSEEQREEFYNRACEFLTEKGYRQYAAHRFALNDVSRDRHYLLRMRGTEFFGFGLGSATRADGFTYRNTSDYSQYIAHSGEFDQIVCDAAEVPEALLAECWLTGRLRLSEGFSPEEFFAEFPVGYPAGWSERLETLIENGYLAEDKGRLSMTRAGFFRIEKLLPEI